VSCNVTRADDIKAALHAAVDRFGRLDIAFNNAGIDQPIKPAAEISDDEWTASWQPARSAPARGSSGSGP
jgi:NAD(P)-dependent dehydrogenase (short-subunit alcohol dehydrogenase family)